MSPTQKQQEMARFKGMTQEQMKQYLTNMGFDTSFLNKMDTPMQQGEERNFKY